MQMFKRLLLIFVLLLLVSGCAKPPVESMRAVQDIVARAYTVGADRHAPGEYQLASSALQAAELQVESKNYSDAVKTIELARRYAVEALRLAVLENDRLATEKNKLEADKKRAELKQQQVRKQELELERLAELRRQQELKKKIIIVNEVIPEELKLVAKVEVREGDDLAIIASRPEVYSDRLLWPLIYKANRDQIKNPEEIFSGQIFIVPRDKTNEESDAARQEALELDIF